MTNQERIHHLIDTVPMPRSEPKPFSNWLREVARTLGMKPEALGARAGVRPDDMRATLSLEATKGQRREVYDLMLIELDRCDAIDERLPSAVVASDVSVYFTGRVGEHRGRCQNLLADAIRDASTHIRMMSYWFYSPLISEALVDAARRIKVEMVIDGTVRGRPRFPDGHKVKIHVDNSNHRAHNKIVIIDEEVVFTGSFNFTTAADDKNAENLLALRNPSVISQFVNYWQQTVRETTSPFETDYPPIKRRVAIKKGSVKMRR